MARQKNSATATAGKPARDTSILLNGLPRHPGQAKAIDAILNVDAVVHLRCPSETVIARIRANAGGDRTDRTDDDPEAIRNKLRIFSERTAPLLEHYAGRGTEIVAVEVTATMTPGQMWEALDGHTHWRQTT